ncbi:hypothetical protein GOP47_0020069 [Adiantum capillus-veneris]|uniref:Pentatricopeptide repeat-containing protein n=1 Tax=Adiantum capillus-veneris TaxID=13818 RepID=A0A9D4UC97_ADICA|nr:hypothetical protein GOP47_0020069 [Adiantum capillus-veneris]
MLRVKRQVMVASKMYVSMAIQEMDVQSLLENCHAGNDIHSSRRLLFWMACNGLECLPLYADYLIRSFASSSNLAKACQVFLKVSTATVYTWNAIISAHAQHSHHEQVLVLFSEMGKTGMKGDRITFLCILKVCSAYGTLVEGKLIHMMAVEMGFDIDVMIGSTLVHMYGKCATLHEACKVFHTLPIPNVVSWGALITGYACHGDCMQALQFFEEMQRQGLEPEKSTFLSALKACANVGATTEGQLIHDQVIRTGLHADIAVSSALMDMYGKCRRRLELHKLFRDLPNHDAVSWASFMSSFAQHEDTLSVFDLLQEMEKDGIIPDQACVDMAGVQGRIIHDLIIKANIESYMAVANSLVDMYAKGGCLQEAENMFSKVKRPNLISCSAMISGYVREGCAFLACDLFERMENEGIRPDKVTFLAALRACGSLGAIGKGRQIHSTLTEDGMDRDFNEGMMLVNYKLSGRRDKYGRSQGRLGLRLEDKYMRSL